MFALSVFSTLLAASSAIGASISISKRDLSSVKRDDGCAGFPVNGLKDNKDFFELWAQYDDDNRTESQLPLAMGTFGTSANVQFAFLAPSQFAGTTVGNLFQLNNSGLIGVDGNNRTKTWISGSTDDGGPLPFSVSKDPNENPGIAEDYCELFNTDPNGSPFHGPVLAGEGSADDWSICNRTNTHNPLQLGLALRAADFSEDYGFNFTTCRPVHVILRSSVIGNNATSATPSSR